MEELERRIRQLEVELVGKKFKNTLLMDKLNVTVEEMKEFAQSSLAEFPESDQKTDMYYYLIGMMKGEQL